MKTKSFLLPLAALVLFSLTFSGCKKDGSQASEKPDYAINFVPAKTGNELLGLKAGSQANLIRTAANFSSLLNDYKTPLSKLSSSQLGTFSRSLVYRGSGTGAGVVSLNYGVLKSNLSSEDFEKVMSYFGIDARDGYWSFSTSPAVQAQMKASSEPGTAGFRTVRPADSPSEDHYDYKCLSKGTCQAATDNICLSGC